MAQFHGYTERAEDRKRDQIEYPDERPEVRERFERELAKRRLHSLMPVAAYASAADAWLATWTRARELESWLRARGDTRRPGVCPRPP
jgi:hypothetical protein